MVCFSRCRWLAGFLFGIVVLYGADFHRTGLSCAQAQDGIGSETSTPIERADGAQLSAATGHFSRSRSLLQAAIQEFDRGRRLADPSSLINVERFRANLVSAAEALGKVLDPQPRASEGGVRFEPDRRLLGEAEKE